MNEIAADDRGDLDEVLFDADHSQALAASFNFLRREWKFVAPEVCFFFSFQIIDRAPGMQPLSAVGFT